jgi:hypothetical protein
MVEGMLVGLDGTSSSSRKMAKARPVDASFELTPLPNTYPL